MSSQSEWQKAISRLKKPFEFAAGLPPDRLSKTMPTLAMDALAILKRDPALARAAPELEDKLVRLDRMSARERGPAIVDILRYLDRLSDRQAPARPGPSPREREVNGCLKDLETEVQWVKGVGPALAERLSRLGVLSVEDLLYHLPSRYEDRRDVTRIIDLEVGSRATVIGKIMMAGPVWKGRIKRGYTVTVSDESGFLNLKWFSYMDYIERKFEEGRRVIVSGVVKTFGRHLEMNHPDIAVLDEDDESESGGIVPVYPATEGLFQKTLRRVVRNALERYLGRVPELLPRRIRDQRGLMNLAEALAAVHAPPPDAELERWQEHRSEAHRRLVYDEFFFLELGLALKRRGMIEEPAPAFPARGFYEKFRSALPFKLTGDQEKVIGEILADLARPRAMHRLLQGDVGSGKTVVSLAAAMAAIESGCQVSIMAPTEILAEQHYRGVSALVAPLGIEVALLTGSVRGAAREQLLARVAAGDVSILVGTHAVIQEKVEFKRLGLGVVDEQHRFGVMQRAKLKQKGAAGLSPHLLVMTATPIPRTLAMTVYGDLAVSVIRQMPPGRRPIATRLFREKERKDVYALVGRELAQGRQAYLVYPLVEESERLDLRDAISMFEYLKNKAFPERRVELIHGRMKSADKDRVMRAFSGGEVDVLVSTTVIEVGIDVQNATVMVVEHAERFGLSQLHQLRGRVGRGEHDSLCCLVAGFTGSEDAYRRLKVMERTQDGFKIAEEDLAIRGPGEFFGTRQSGLPDFRVANIIRDAEILRDAREDAFELVGKDPRFEDPDHRVLEVALKKRWGRRLRLGGVG